MLDCSTCGAANADGARFCAQCGRKLASAASCPSCGAETTPEQRFCSGCGHALSERAAASSPSVASEPVGERRRVPTSLASGRYRIGRFLGEGAKKRVYLAHDALLDRDVALALLKTEGLDAAGIARVRREAQSMGRLGDHPHIVTVFDVGQDAGAIYIVSRFVAGGDVGQRLENAPERRLPLEEALRIAIEACSALAACARAGHRASRPQARQRLVDRIWCRHAGRLRAGSGHRSDAHHPGRHDGRDGGLHATGAGRGRSRDGALRPVFARRDALRDAGGSASLRRGHGRRDHQSAPEHATGGAVLAQFRRRRGARGARARAAREGSRRTPAERRRGEEPAGADPGVAGATGSRRSAPDARLGAARVGALHRPQP